MLPKGVSSPHSTTANTSKVASLLPSLALPLQIVASNVQILEIVGEVFSSSIFSAPVEASHRRTSRSERELYATQSSSDLLFNPKSQTKDTKLCAIHHLQITSLPVHCPSRPAPDALNQHLNEFMLASIRPRGHIVVVCVHERLPKLDHVAHVPVVMAWHRNHSPSQAHGYKTQ